MTVWQKINPPAAVRRWAYGVLAAGIGVLVVYRVIDGDQAAAWLLLGAAALGVAAGNTPTRPGADG